MTVLVGKRCLCCSGIHLRSLQQESQFCGIYASRKIIYTAEVEALWAIGRRSAYWVLNVLRTIGRWAIGYGRGNKMGMLVHDSGLSSLAFFGYFNMDIQ